jgi:hypothetical protein
MPKSLQISLPTFRTAEDGLAALSSAAFQTELTAGQSLLSFSPVVNGHEATVQFDHGIAPWQVSTRALAFGMFNAPGDDLPTICRFQNLPFYPFSPLLILLEDTPGNGDLVVVTAFRILGLFHAAHVSAASAEQPCQ